MIEFLSRPDLWTNIIGGFVAALLVTFLLSLPGKKKKKILKELIEIMGRAIVHRNLGKNEQLINNKEEWIQKAEELKLQAVAKGCEMSPATGSVIEWLDQIEPYPPSDQVKRWVSILSKMIERIRGIIERNS